jgi:Flp pilus assembly pilin Flp
MIPERRKAMKKISNFLRDETGMETLEYALIAGLIAVVALLVYGSGWGTTLKTKLTNAANGVTS